LKNRDVLARAIHSGAKRRGLAWCFAPRAFSNRRFGDTDLAAIEPHKVVARVYSAAASIRCGSPVSRLADGISDTPNGILWNIDPRADRLYSALMLAARITLPHFSVSSAMSLPKSAGEPAPIATAGALRRQPGATRLSGHPQLPTSVSARRP
jgi:hypothetical protein